MTALAAPVHVFLDTDDHDVASIPEVRRAMAAWLDERGVAGDARDAVLLVASELVTNALRHTMGRVLVTACEVDGSVLVQVHDESEDLPNPLLAKPEELGGRGLAIVEALADRWGAEHASVHGRPGKVVWASVRRAA